MALGLADLLGSFGKAVVAKQVAAQSLGPRRGCCCYVGSVQSHLPSTQMCPLGSAGWHCSDLS